MLDVARARQLLTDFDLAPLFIEELGWDRYHDHLDVVVDGRTYTLTGIAEKRHMVALLASFESVPDPVTRRSIERAVAKNVHEHLIVFCDEAQTEQVWHWVRRESGRPAATREDVFRSGHSGERLAQKLDALSFSLDEEGEITIVDVTQRVRAAFDVERVTRQFYERFQDEHDAFKGFITGLNSQQEIEWYASIMLNRLMFVYFIQKKGFLDEDRDYLRNRLRRVQASRGKEQFLTFYRHFLLRLFHEGLGGRARTRDLDELIGEVPYLNGGLFDVHELEHDNPELHISDEAFETILNFFDAYQWHLDDRPLRSDSDINPDVLGYVFERYVNRKEKGAYYTKDDVSYFMTAASVIPAYLDRVVEAHPIVIEQLSDLIVKTPDRYIFSSLRDTGRLPGEDPIVAAARHMRCELLRERLQDFGLTSIDDLITLNLDAFTLARDHLLTVDEPDVVATAYSALKNLSILDPTCGSGAFLFAALNLLEPLYEASIERMRQLLLDDAAAQCGTEFSDIIDEVAQHPSPSYFITKSVIARNLYGVDLLREACEICKLRLFLRLVSEVETARELEPLPDIDFNIRSGNTLIGFSSERAARERETGTRQVVLDVGHHLDDVIAKAEDAGRAFETFRQAQQSGLPDQQDAVRRAKSELTKTLGELPVELDEMLVPETWKDGLEAWRSSRTPFHWFAEFYDLMESGGFDVVIGNPPYVQRKNVDYEIEGFQTEGAADIYANVVERAIQLLAPHGRYAMIVPLSLTFSRDFGSLRRLVDETCEVSWFSSFGRIPDVLFSDDVRVRNTIHIARRGEGRHRRFTTQLHRWLTEYRPHLFQVLRYVEFEPTPYGGLIPKVGTERLEEAFRGLLGKGRSLADDLNRRGSYKLYFKQTAYNWLAFSLDEPPCFDASGASIPQSKVGSSSFEDEETRDLALLLLNGKLMFAWWRMIGDDFDVTETSFKTFPFRLSLLDEQTRKQLRPLVPRLVELMNKHVSFKLNAGKRVGTYNLARCRSVTDEADRILAAAIGVEHVLDEVELLYAETVKTAFEPVA